MAKTKYRIKDTQGRLSVTLPQKLAFALGIVDMDGNLTANCVRFELGMDDSGSYGIIRPEKYP